jgi:hypothetical protein
MSLRRCFTTSLAILLTVALAEPANAASAYSGQDQVPHRGRKYKVPPETSHIEVAVTRDDNGKPIENAAVIFHSLMDGKDEGNLEVKTNGEGKAVIDVIPTGSNVDVQIIADGFATYAGAYLVKEADRAIEIKMVRPRAQISTYVDNTGKPSDRPAGVQEPRHPRTSPVIQTPQPTRHASDPNPISPVDPNRTPDSNQNPTPQPH